MTDRYEVVATSTQSTVVAEFAPDPSRTSAYQSEAELERALIRQLQGQAYEFLQITDEDALIANLRTQLERLH